MYLVCAHCKSNARGVGDDGVLAGHQSDGVLRNFAASLKKFFSMV
jgi:hypothetical protein